MKDEKVTAAPSVLEIADQEFEAFPLTDRDLDALTQWCRYKLQKDARAQAEFAENDSERDEIIATAYRQSLNVKWFDEVGVNLLLSNRAGLVEVTYRMVQRKWKKDWFYNKFGNISDYTADQLRNMQNVQKLFLQQNTIGESKDTKDTDTSTKSNTKKSSKKN